MEESKRKEESEALQLLEKIIVNKFIFINLKI
jgi:hypothetical protein